MFCKHCYADLGPATTAGKCPKCQDPFDTAKPRTYLTRPFPPILRIIGQVIATTVLAFIAAWAVAMFQAAKTSSH